MSQPNNRRKPATNRPTDPFGGPLKRGNTISITFILAAFAIFALLQWSNGDLGGLINAPTNEVIEKTPAATDATQVASATVMAQPTLPPTAINEVASTSQASATEPPPSTVQPTPTANAPPTAEPTATGAATIVPAIARASDLPTVAYADLPPEAHDTIALIDADGPFPFSRDGVTFQNRERILPLKSEGYYREYTVITPGASNRGARRIVAGDAGEMYYTDDHYDSFREIMR